MARTWALLVYTMPREPTAPRVAVWRKLKKLGAMRLHDAAWALPVTPTTLKHLRWLVAEIQEGQGQATLWHAQGDSLADETQLVEYFLTQADCAYRELLTALRQPEADRAELARRYRRIQAIDYLHAPSGETVRVVLEGAQT